MRKIILGLDMTLDGVVEGNEKWRFAYASPDLAEYDSLKVNSLDAMLLGRKTYEIFAAFWPNQTHNEFGIADKLNNAQKFVVSSTITKAEWRNSTIIGDDVEEEIKKIKNQSGGDIGITGSITLAQWLMERNLIDEYDLLTFPTVLGAGRRLFKEGFGMPLELIESRDFSSGAILSKYKPTMKQAF